MPDNKELSDRAHQLVTDIQSFTQSAKQHCDEYRALSDEACSQIQSFIRSQGVTTVDEWLNLCQKELSPDEASAVQKALSDLEPAKGFSALVQPTEIAKFIASWYIVKGGVPLCQATALSVKAWYHNYLVINRLPVVEAGAAAGEVEVGSIASVTEELTEAAEFLESEEIPTLLVATEAEVGELMAAEVAISAEVGVVATAEAASSWNLVLLGVGALVLAGTLAYSKIKENQDAERLKEIVAKLATARLYALVGERSLLVQTDEHSLLYMLNKALKEGNNAAQDFMKKQALETIQKCVTAIDVKVCYEQLRQRDESANAMVEGDPSFDDMARRHTQEVQQQRNK